MPGRLRLSICRQGVGDAVDEIGIHARILHDLVLHADHFFAHRSDFVRAWIVIGDAVLLVDRARIRQFIGGIVARPYDDLVPRIKNYVAVGVAQLAEQRMGFPNVVMTPDEITLFVQRTAEGYRRQAAPDPTAN